MEEGNDGALELCATSRVDCVRAEGLPDDALANVGGDKEGNAGSKPIALLEQLVKADDNDAGEEELEDDEDGVDSAEILDFTIHTRYNVGYCLSDCDEDTKQLLSPLEELAIGLDAVIDVNNLRACGSRDRLAQGRVA